MAAYQAIPIDFDEYFSSTPVTSFLPTTSSSSSSGNNNSSNQEDRKKLMLIGGLVGALVVLLVIVIPITHHKKHHHNHQLVPLGEFEVSPYNANLVDSLDQAELSREFEAGMHDDDNILRIWFEDVHVEDDDYLDQQDIEPNNVNVDVEENVQLDSELVVEHDDNWIHLN